MLFFVTNVIISSFDADSASSLADVNFPSLPSRIIALFDGLYKGYEMICSLYRISLLISSGAAASLLSDVYDFV